MSVSYAPTKLRVPPGFEHLLEGLAREALREQPKDVIAFAAEYFKKKLAARDGTAQTVAADTQVEQPPNQDAPADASNVTKEEPVITSNEDTPVPAQLSSAVAGEIEGGVESSDAQREDVSGEPADRGEEGQVVAVEDMREDGGETQEGEEEEEGEKEGEEEGEEEGEKEEVEDKEEGEREQKKGQGGGEGDEQKEDERKEDTGRAETGTPPEAVDETPKTPEPESGLQEKEESEGRDSEKEGGHEGEDNQQSSEELKPPELDSGERTEEEGSKSEVPTSEAGDSQGVEADASQGEQQD